MVGSKRRQCRRIRKSVKSGWQSGHTVRRVRLGAFQCCGAAYSPASKKVSANALSLLCVGFQSVVARLLFRLTFVAWVRRVVISCWMPGNL